MASVLSGPVVSKPLGLRDRAVLEVLYSCGLRRNELIELSCRDIDSPEEPFSSDAAREEGPLRADWRAGPVCSGCIANWSGLIS